MSCQKNISSRLPGTAKAYNFQLLIIFFLFIICSSHSYAQQDPKLKNTLPTAGKLKNDKPQGKGWVSLLTSAEDWNFETTFWQLNDHLLHGSLGKEKEHHYSYT